MSIQPLIRDAGPASRALGTTICALLLTGTVLCGQSTTPSTVGFRLELHPTVFDGVHMEIVHIVSPDFRLTTDTLAAWIPLSQPVAMSGISFRHRGSSETTLSISLLGSAWVGESTATWERYQAMIRQQIPGEVAISQAIDSADGPPALRLLGNRTREAVFTAVSAGTETGTAEHHIFVTHDQHPVVFVLRAKADAIEKFASDFRFFVSRLSAGDDE